MKEKFLSNFLLLFIVNLVVKPAWLFGDLLVQRTTGEAYGKYFVLFNLSLLFNMLLDMGTSNYNNRKLAGNPNKFAVYFSNVMTLRLVLSSIYLILLMGTAVIFSYTEKELNFLFVLGLSQILLAFITYFRANLTALGHFKLDSIVSVTDRIMMCILLFGLFYFDAQKVSISSFIYVQFWGYITAFLLVLVFLISQKGWVFPRFKWRFKKVLILKSYPYALITILMLLYSYSDSIMLDRMLSNGMWENMIYAQSFRVLMASNNYIYLVAILLLPLFSKMIKKRESVAELLRLSGSLVIYGTLVLALLCSYFSSEFIHLLYAHYDESLALLDRFNSSSEHVLNEQELVYSAKVFQVLLWSIIPMSFNYIYGVLLTAGGKMKILNQIAGTGVVLNIALNWWLIPNFGAFGAAIASCFTQGLCAVGQWYFCYKEHHISFSVVHFLKFIGAFAALLGLLITLDEFLSSFILFLLASSAAVVFMFLFRISSISNIKAQLVKS